MNSFHTNISINPINDRSNPLCINIPNSPKIPNSTMNIMDPLNSTVTTNTENSMKMMDFEITSKKTSIDYFNKLFNSLCELNEYLKQPIENVNRLDTDIEFESLDSKFQEIESKSKPSIEGDINLENGERISNNGMDHNRLFMHLNNIDYMDNSKNLNNMSNINNINKMQMDMQTSKFIPSIHKIEEEYHTQIQIKHIELQKAQNLLEKLKIKYYITKKENNQLKIDNRNLNSKLDFCVEHCKFYESKFQELVSMMKILEEKELQFSNKIVVFEALNEKLFENTKEKERAAMTLHGYSERLLEQLKESELRNCALKREISELKCHNDILIHKLGHQDEIFTRYMEDYKALESQYSELVLTTDSVQCETEDIYRQFNTILEGYNKKIQVLEKQVKEKNDVIAQQILSEIMIIMKNDDKSKQSSNNIIPMDIDRNMDRENHANGNMSVDEDINGHMDNDTSVNRYIEQYSIPQYENQMCDLYSKDKVLELAHKQLFELLEKYKRLDGECIEKEKKIIDSTMKIESLQDQLSKTVKVKTQLQAAIHELKLKEFSHSASIPKSISKSGNGGQKRRTSFEESGNCFSCGEQAFGLTVKCSKCGKLYHQSCVNVSSRKKFICCK